MRTVAEEVLGRERRSETRGEQKEGTRQREEEEEAVKADQKSNCRGRLIGEPSDGEGEKCEIKESRRRRSEKEKVKHFSA